MGRGESAVMSTCMQRDHVPIFDADEAITNGVFARLQMAAHNSAPRSTSDVASVPDEGCNQRFIIKVIRLSDYHQMQSDVTRTQTSRAISVQSHSVPEKSAATWAAAELATWPAAELSLNLRMRGTAREVPDTASGVPDAAFGARLRRTSGRQAGRAGIPPVAGRPHGGHRSSARTTANATSSV